MTGPPGPAAKFNLRKFISYAKCACWIEVVRSEEKFIKSEVVGPDGEMVNFCEVTVEFASYAGMAECVYKWVGGNEKLMGRGCRIEFARDRCDVLGLGENGG